MSDFDYIKLANQIFPDIGKTPEDYERIYPKRDLPEGAKVTRIAPSPTGYLHIGTLFVALCDRRVADSSGGVFILRIEDTDKKREIADGVSDIINGLESFGICFDEGCSAVPGEEKGDYGPYMQSKRVDIYHCYVKSLLEKGLAYPCFCTEDELGVVRAGQEAHKLRTGYYGEYAKCRDLTPEQAGEKIHFGTPFVIRLKSPGSEENRIKFDDGVKGSLEMPENDQDIVLLKSDMIPTYHFAHAVDDHLMRTTHVIRGDEWLSSVPVHLQLFKMLGHKTPKYAHLSPIMKEDAETGGKRKLSKRKDPEAAAKFFVEQGYPGESIIEYLMTIANSDYEEWRRINPGAGSGDFNFSLKKMSISGALFDIDKLNDVSKNVISRMQAREVYGMAAEWARQHDRAFYDLFTRDGAYAVSILQIDRGTAKPRKDIAKWGDVRHYCSYFFDELYEPAGQFPLEKADVKAILEKYMEIYSPDDDHDRWFDNIRDISATLGFSPDMKAYKKNPGEFKGHIGDVSGVIRMAVTGRANSPDLHEIMRLLGRDRVVRRMREYI